MYLARQLVTPSSHVNIAGACLSKLRLSIQGRLSFVTTASLLPPVNFLFFLYLIQLLPLSKMVNTACNSPTATPG